MPGTSEVRVKKSSAPTPAPNPLPVPRPRADALTRLARLAPWALAVLVWAVFNPGIFPPDATHILYFAYTRDYCNPHPVILLVLARQVINWLLYPGFITLIQSVFIIQGIRYLAAQLLMLADPACRDDAARRDRRAALVLLVLLAPLTPLMFTAVSFLKDAWMLGGVAWMTGLLAKLSRRDEPRSPAAEAGLVLACSAMTAFSVLFRYNAVVLMPLFCVLLFVVVQHRKLRWLAVMPVVALLGANLAMKTTLTIREEYPERQVMFLDIIGMCVLEPELEQVFPELMSQTRPDYANFYAFGDMTRLYEVAPFNIVMYGNQEPRRDGFKKDAIVPTIYPRVLQHPFTLARVKLYSFLRLYFSTSYTDVFMRGIFQQPLQLPENPYFASLRSQLYEFYDFWLMRSPTRWLMSVHLPWNVGGVVLLVWMWRKRHALRWLALVPVAYPFTFLPATTAMDFRFLMPSTMVLQVFVLVLALSGAFARKTPAAQPVR